MGREPSRLEVHCLECNCHHVFQLEYPRAIGLETSLSGEYDLCEFMLIDAPLNDSGIVALYHESTLLWAKKFSVNTYFSVLDTGDVVSQCRHWTRVIEKTGNIAFQEYIYDPCGISQNSLQDLVWFFENNDIGVLIFDDSIKHITLPDPREKYHFLPQIDDILKKGSDAFLFTFKGIDLIVLMSSNGEILNSLEVESQIDTLILSSSSPYSAWDRLVAMNLPESYQQMPVEQQQFVIDAINKTLHSAVSDHTKARAAKLYGEIAELSGNNRVAIEWYEFALSWNPKIGIKKRLAGLHKKTSAP